MKFDPLNWNEVKPNEKIKAPKGWLRLRVSSPAPLYLEAYGVETLVGVETSFNVEISEAMIFHIDAPVSVRVFLEQRETSTVEASGETFTNIDRMSQGDSSTLAVTQALRQFKLEQNAALREIRAEREALAAEREAASEPVTEPVVTEPVTE